MVWGELTCYSKPFLKCLCCHLFEVDGLQLLSWMHASLLRERERERKGERGEGKEGGKEGERKEGRREIKNTLIGDRLLYITVTSLHCQLYRAKKLK